LANEKTITAWEERYGSMNQSQLIKTLKIPRTTIRNIINTFMKEERLQRKEEELALRT
jgi:DNA-binding IclR family transcriptional regulator